MSPVILKLEISSDLTQVVKVREFVREVAMRHMRTILNNESISELVHAVHEVTTNIIKHSYRGRMGKPILIEAHPTDTRLTILLNHWGEDFAPVSADPPVFDGAEVSGVGLFIIENRVDEVTYDRSQNGKCTISLVKESSRIERESTYGS
jgi:anti-sigma regulatory factor (Ser/Thr protein kinase)